MLGSTKGDKTFCEEFPVHRHSNIEHAGRRFYRRCVGDERVGNGGVNENGAEIRVIFGWDLVFREVGTDRGGATKSKERRS